MVEDELNNPSTGEYFTVILVEFLTCCGHTPRLEPYTDTRRQELRPDAVTVKPHQLRNRPVQVSQFLRSRVLRVPENGHQNYETTDGFFDDLDEGWEQTILGLFEPEEGVGERCGRALVGSQGDGLLETSTWQRANIHHWPPQK